ncbi:probable peroxidase 26 [Aristolochia californica]|uniref:probable peroxidase 26 n=1 Tax=Aristolochia californica TaxID=171875 RepID=UPI0035DD82E1
MTTYVTWSWRENVKTLASGGAHERKADHPINKSKQFCKLPLIHREEARKAISGPYIKVSSLQPKQQVRLEYDNGSPAVTLPPAKTVLHFYKINKTCEYAEEFVKHQVKLVWDNDPSITAALLRLLYADCFVTGCDASILLDGPESEKTAPQNLGLRGFVLIDNIKKVLESRCPGVVSCADILHLATRDALAFAGAPAYPVFTGRRDGTISSSKSVDLPPPSITWQEGLAYFKSKGLNVLDFATLLGAHTMGKTRCRHIRDRLYNFNGTGKPDPTIKPSFLKELREQCPEKRVGRYDPSVFLNPSSGNRYEFQNSFYSNVQNKTAVLGIDQQLRFGEDTLAIAEEFSAGFEDFRRAFALAISRMGNLGVLTGKQGEIRLDCRTIRA